MDSPRTKPSSSDVQRQKQTQRQKDAAGVSDPATPRSSSGMQMSSDDMLKLHEGQDSMNFSLHGQYGDAFDVLAATDNLPLSMAHKARKDDGAGSSKNLRPYPVLSGVQGRGRQQHGLDAHGQRHARREGDLHPFEVSSTSTMPQQQKLKQKQKQKLQTTGHHASTITAAALPSKVFNGEAWLLDPYGTGNNPLSASDLQMNKGKSAVMAKGRTLGKATSGNGASGAMLDQYGEMDTRRAGRSASLASDGEIELPAKHESVQDRLGSPGADDLGI
ncbi:uncharacterized protein PG998_008425 [Apiospora kogelbergensis]|uniref:uncharacterized protein n=1 Tax=Apiospora kogelbergensis TaxID=1337665 RepID=UPI00312E7509